MMNLTRRRRSGIAVVCVMCALLLALVPARAADEITAPHTSPTPTTGQDPLIFIPGILGSRLKEIGGSELWPGVPRLHKGGLTLEPGNARDIIATDVIRDYLPGLSSDDVYIALLGMLTDPTRGGYVEYRVDNAPTHRTTEGCDLGQGQPTLFVFAYDWRKSNAANAELLADYVGCIRRIHGDTQVNILAHSMGGLLARRYLLDTPDHHVGKLITIGTPWLGAPKAIHTLFTGEQSFPITPLFVQPSQLKELVQFFPSVHQLLPNRAYYTLGDYALGDPVPLQEAGWDINRNGQAFEAYTYAAYATLLDTSFAVSKPVAANDSFHENGQDDWRNDTSGVQFYHIYGIQPYAATVGGVRTVTRTSCRLFVCNTEETFELAMTLGDGTVPLISATRTGAGQYLNAPGARLKVFVSAEANDVEHTELTKQAAVHTYLLAALRAEEPLLQETSAIPPSGPAYYVTVTGAADLTISDSQGHSTSTTSPTTRLEPEVTYYGLGADSHLLVLPSDQNYTITWSAGSNPLAVDVALAKGDTPLQAVRFRDLVLPGGGTAQLTLAPFAEAEARDPARNAVLRHDQDSDGTFETTLAPTVAVRDTAAQDVEPPVVMVTASGEAASQTVTITAHDADAGVSRILYSLDGTHYQPYTGPFTVDATQTPAVYAFADDAVANRASRVVYELIDARSVYLPVITR